MKLIRNIFIITIVLVSQYSCVDDKDLILNDPNAFDADDFQLTTEDEVLAFATAAYGDLQVRGTYARHAFFIHDGASDECSTTNMEIDKQQMHNYTVDPANIGITRYWIACNQGIGKTNGVIENRNLIESISPLNLSDEIKNQAIGENYFLRGLYYFMLTTRFGGVPMPLKVVRDLDGTPKSTQEEVYNQILLDLDEAIALCSTKAELGSANFGRATKGAAYALKGKVLLYRERYAEAVAAFEQVQMDPSGYTTQGVPFEDNFSEDNEHNAESIFEVNFSSAFSENGVGAAWTPSGSGNAETSFRAIEYADFGNLPVGPNLVNAFEANDPRKDATYRTSLRWRKYTYPDNQIANSGINIRIIRMADVLLMKAEALNEVDSGANKTEILALMNEVRTRVGMPAYGTADMDAIYPVGTKEEILAAIQHERQVELAGEQVRLNDILRWGIAKEKIEENRNNTPAGVIVNFTEGKHELFPIPSLEIDNNKLMDASDQNPGY